MITKDELLSLLNSTETYRVEKTISTTNMDKFCEAICAFANDMPNSKKQGYLLIGVHDDGTRNGLKVTDELLQKISAIRTDGNILPLPVMSVDTIAFEDGEVLVVEVTPSVLPPVRYRGRTFIRISARKDLATREEEDLLVERRAAHFPTFDANPCMEATLDDLDLEQVRSYLVKAIDEEVLAEDHRNLKHQMAALRLYDLYTDRPTYAAIILFGKNPKYFLFGNYIQFVRFAGKDNASDILNQYEFKGSLASLLPKLNTFIETALVQSRPVPVSALQEEIKYNFPLWALRELVMNAVMHRDYRANTPTKLYQYCDHIEIINAGGLYGHARPENFPNVNDYRNPIVAEGMKVLGYVNMFNRGVNRVQTLLEENENGKAEFIIDRITVFGVVIKDASINDEVVTENDTKNVTKNVTRVETEKTRAESEKTRVETEKTRVETEKTRAEILKLLKQCPMMTMRQIAAKLNISLKGIEWQISKLKSEGLIRHIGPNKGGRWEIIDND